MSGVAPLRSFELRCWARAYLLQHCLVASFDEAFQPLWADATRDGLVAQYGAAVLMAIIDDVRIKVSRAEVDE